MELLLILVVALLISCVGAWWYLGQQKKAPVAVGEVRYSVAEAISPAHMSLLTYLRTAFPDRAVLFRPRLDQLVLVRNAEDRQQALDMLAAHVVDFVVCDAKGEPEYLFDVRLRSANIDESQHRRELVFKSQVLKSVGLRLLSIHRSVSKLPMPEEFVIKLAESLGKQPPVQPRSSSNNDKPESGSREGNPTEPASVSQIMGWPPEPHPPTLPG